jgi:hypothetical protein
MFSSMSHLQLPKMIGNTGAIFGRGTHRDFFMPDKDQLLSPTMLAQPLETSTPSAAGAFNASAEVPRATAMGVLMAAELQDHLMVVGNDLDRLRRLLDDAGDALMRQFTLANDSLNSGDVQAARQTLGGAITALQFQDMANQLIHHTSKRLRNCADRIARDAMGDDEDGVAVIEEAPLRPNPVTQDEMDAGAIDLF